MVAFDVALAPGLLDALEAGAKVGGETEVGVAVLPVARIKHIHAGGEQGEVVEGHGRGRGFGARGGR